MENKSIGKFIAILRKEKGMTQKELGNKLFVSDKTISRWEHDECTPELSLILKIAEIFEITADELLRGEKDNINSNKNIFYDTENKMLNSSNINATLYNRYKRYNNQTLISCCILMVGLIISIIINLGFSKGLIAFCLACVFCIIGEICQICFVINAHIYLEPPKIYETDNVYYKFNNIIIKKVIIFSFINLAILAFCTPLVTIINGANNGLSFNSWILYGSLFVVIVLAISYIIYALFVRKYLLKKKIIIYSSEKKKKLI